MSGYTCDICNKHFSQKSGLDRHKNRKAPCISLEVMQQIADEQNNQILQLETREEIIQENFVKSGNFA
jgi:hypothetical protein